MKKEPIFYDIEVFKRMNVAGFMNHDKKGYVIVNAPNLESSKHEILGVVVYINVPETRDRATKYLSNETYNLFGFNNHGYDDFLIQDILTNRPTEYIKLKSDNIVKKERYRERLEWWSYDLREQMPIGFSLKKFESMAGLQVEESSIPFDKDDNFTLEEVLEVVHYNLIDLIATVALFDEREDYFNGKELLVDEYGYEGAQRWSNGSISANYLMGRDKLSSFVPDKSIIYGVPEGVQLFLESAEVFSPMVSKLPTASQREALKRKLYSEMKTEEHGMVYTWAWGGLHSAKGKTVTSKRGTKKIEYELIDETDVLQWDVTSMFPFIIIRDNLLGSATDKFKKLVYERVQNKKTNKALAGTQKIVVNAVYGLLRLLSSKLFNPESAIHVNVSGMVAVYNLADRIDKVGILYQVNTDGIAFKPYPETTQAQLDEIREKWEREFELGLETSKFDRLIQRDVNNYIAVNPDGKLKLKGGAVSQAIKVDVTKASTPSIIDYMLVQKIVYDKPFIITVSHGAFRDYTFTLKAMKSATQSGKMVKGDTILENEVNRVYASNDGEPILKHKTKGENAKFPDTPDKMEVANYKLPKERPDDLDLNYYVELAEKKYEKWSK